MVRPIEQRASGWRRSWGRAAAAAVVVGGLTALAVAPNAADAAVNPRTASVIAAAKNANLGTILVAGDTVYTLKPSKTACTADCLRAWPPVLLRRGVTTPTAGPNVDASKLGTAAAAKGARQITYSGKRLYWFTKDKGPGQVHGNVKDKWGKWSTVTSAVAQTPATIGATTPPPATDAPATAPPATEAPATAPPATEAPGTAPPATEPSVPATTRPPSTTTPSTGGTGF